MTEKEFEFETNEEKDAALNAAQASDTVVETPAVEDGTVSATDTAADTKVVVEDDEVGKIVPMNTKRTRKEKRAEKKKLKEDRSIYHVSNWQILKNYRNYNQSERAHYRYIFGRRVSDKVWPIFRFLIIFGLSFIILYPLLYMISTSIRPQAEMNDPSVMWIPKQVIITNFTEIWEAIDYPYVIGQTLLVNVVCSILQVITCSITGYGFARFKFKGRGFLFGIVIMQIIVPVQILLIPLYTQFRFFDIFGIITAMTGEPLNLVETPIALYFQALFCNGIRAGLFILLFRQFFRGLPKELEDAAYLDGCGPFQTFLRIMVPNAKGTFLTVFIFSIVWYWNDSYVTGMFCDKSSSISLAIQNIGYTISMWKTGETRAAVDFLVWIEAGCLLAIMPILIMYIILQKQFTEGIAKSGIVG